MAWFEGTHEETRTLGVSPEVAAAHFADPAAILAATKNVESSSVNDGTIHFVLQEEDHGVAKFKADYRCTYACDGTTVTWSSPEGGNLKQSGTAVFSPAPGGCTVAYRETIALDLPVPSMMAGMVRPLIGPLLAKEVSSYVDRIVSSLD